MLQFPAIFSDHAVFQQGKRVAVWGETDAEEVTIELRKDGQETPVCTVVTYPEAIADDAPGAECVPWKPAERRSRRFFLEYLEPCEAGGPYTLTVRESAAGEASADGERQDGSEGTAEEGGSVRVFRDIVYGEVFLAGGQSNIELSLENSRGGAEEVRNSYDPNVRFYFTPKVAYVGEELWEQERKASWEVCRPEISGWQSAVAYYFARKLAKDLGVTVGIVGCNWGGTSATCWISRSSIEEAGEESLLPYLEAYDEATKDYDEETYLRELAEYKEYDIEFNRKMAEYYKTAEHPSWDDAIKVVGECRYPGPMGPRTWCRPCGLYESMLRRVMPYTLQGFLFYQAEEDDNRPYTYAKLLPLLMRVWRSDWDDDALPFLLVQLPGYNGEGEEDTMNWPVIREIQTETARWDPNAACVVTIDCGDRANVHPLDKRPVGERLALQALRMLYGKAGEAEACGPEAAEWGFRTSAGGENGLAVVAFSNAPGGLFVKTPEDWNLVNPEEAGKGELIPAEEAKPGQITGFELAGEDRIYHPAQASVSGSEVTLSSEAVREPKYIRYLWRNYQNVTLYGKNQIPAAPFRTSRDDGFCPIASRQGELRESGSVREEYNRGTQA